MSGDIHAVRPCSNVLSCRPAAAYVGGSAPVRPRDNTLFCRPATAYVGGTGRGWVSIRNLYAASMNMVRARMRSPQKTGACSYAEYTKNRRVPGQWTGVRA